MRQALHALADLVRVNIKDAHTITRNHGLWEEELHIEEELINLREAFATNIAASESLRAYPKMRMNFVKEQRAILGHCIGLLSRMVAGGVLPREYDQRDVAYAMTRLVRMITDEALRVGKHIDAEVLAVLRPYMSMRQRMAFRQSLSPDVQLASKLVIHKLTVLRQLQ